MKKRLMEKMLTNNLHCEDGPATKKLKAELIQVLDKQFTRNQELVVFHFKMILIFCLQLICLPNLYLTCGYTKISWHLLSRDLMTGQGK